MRDLRLKGYETNDRTTVINGEGGEVKDVSESGACSVEMPHSRV